MLALAIAAVSGCGPGSPAGSGSVPILLNAEPPPIPDVAALGRPGDKVTLCGVLINMRRLETDPQAQAMISSPPDEPMVGYFLLLTKAVLELPARESGLAAPPGSNLHGPFRITGRLDKTKSADGEDWWLAPTKVTRLDVDPRVVAACKRAVRDNWGRIGEINASIPEGFGRARRLGEFAKPTEPVLVTASVDGKRLLYQCGGGRASLPLYAETLAQVHCLVDTATRKVLRIYVRSTSYALE